MNDENEPGGFKIKDRRLFNEEGNLRSEAPEEEDRPSAAPPAAKPAAAEPSSPHTDTPAPETSSHGGAPPMDFSSFVLSLATTGMVHLGEIVDPAIGQKRENLDGAKQLIEILSLLKEKTQGNLAAEEAQLLEGLLHELRLSFLGKTKTIQL
jgi:hypothetical protein